MPYVALISFGLSLFSSSSSFSLSLVLLLLLFLLLLLSGFLFVCFLCLFVWREVGVVHACLHRSWPKINMAAAAVQATTATLLLLP